MKKKRKIIALVLVLATVFSVCLPMNTVLADDLTDQKNNLEWKLQQIKKDQQALASSLSKAKQEASTQEQVVNLLYQQISSIQAELDTTKVLIQGYTDLTKQKEEEIEALNVQLNQNFELFKKRLVFAQESGNMSYIDFILGSSDIADILARSEQVNDMLEYDRKVIESLAADKKAIEDAKAQIEEALVKCQELEKSYEEQLETMNSTLAEAESALAVLQQNRATQQAAYNAIAAQNAQAQKDLENVVRMISERDAAAAAYSGDWIWPLPRSHPGTITQTFYGTFNSPQHGAIDIAVGGWANNGKIPALASAAGTVAYAGYHWSYGNYVIITHGSNYKTLYAHLASISVSVGQIVGQGQQIGLIGSTGNSTGPHLHFEMYYNGKKVDPQKYVTHP